MSVLAPERPSRAARLTRGVRRAVLARRRLLAAALVAVAVAAGLQAASAPPPELVPVQVAASDLPAGVVLSAADLVTVPFARGSVPDDLARAPTGRILAAPLRRGEPLTDVRLVGPHLTDGRPELAALPVRLPDAAMVELLAAGDRIDLVATDPADGTAEVVARDALVLAVPPPGGSGTDGLTGRLVVLGLDETDVSSVSGAALVHFLTFAYSR